MSDISGLVNGIGHDAEPTIALLSVSAPALVPDNDAFDLPGGDHDAIKPAEVRRPGNFPTASWLDAMPPEAREAVPSKEDSISSVNSDDNGLYRMFIGISP